MATLVQGVSWWNQPMAYSEMAMAISYKWLFLLDYTFYKWGYKYL